MTSRGGGTNLSWNCSVTILGEKILGLTGVINPTDQSQSLVSELTPPGFLGFARVVFHFHNIVLYTLVCEVSCSISRL